MNKLKLIFFACVLWALYLGAASFCDEQTDGFSVARIHSELPFCPEWETAPVGEGKRQELEGILSQEFRYMACGGQCFAFVSADNNYVIKFFKHRIRKPYSYLMKLPLWRNKLEKAKRKLNRDFTSYKIAYEDLPEETGVVYIHLNKGKAPASSVAIVDKLGIKHTLPLEGIEFVLQKRAELAYSHIDHLVQQGDSAKVRHALRSMIDVIVARCQKGYFDEDAKIHRNFGFVGDKPVIIDVGRFVPDERRKEPAIYQADVVAITKQMHKWLMQTHPELTAILDEELREYQAHSF
jgi:hypothetical protein